MTITTLPPSPAGEINHNEVREKINEIITDATLDQEQMFYVSKAGNDSNSGLNNNEPKLTITAAITAAILLTPAVANQITIEVMDTGTYFETYVLPEWVHINAINAANNGRITVSDSTIIRFRRLQNSTPTQPIIRKTDGTGFARITCDLMIVTGAAQEGLLVNMGLAHLDAGVLDIDAGIGIKAKNGARVSFIVPEILLKNGALGLGTRTAGGDPNFTSGSVSYAVDTTGDCILVESRVTGDVINIQAGSLIANTLYDMGAGTTLNVFANEAEGLRVADSTATINAVKSNSISRLTVSRGFLNQPLSIHDGTAGTETTLDFGTFNDGIYNLNNGMIEILVDVRNVQVLTETHVTKTSGGSDSEFSAWVELSDDGGSTWTPFSESLRVEVMAKDGGTVVISELTLGTPIAAGGMFRIRATNTGAAAISVAPPNDLVVSTGTADGFATKVTLRTLL
jgi:hypothetical protein